MPRGYTAKQMKMARKSPKGARIVCNGCSHEDQVILPGVLNELELEEAEAHHNIILVALHRTMEKARLDAKRKQVEAAVAEYLKNKNK